MPAPSSSSGGAAGSPPPPPVPPRRGPARDVDGLIRDLQRINLSQCMDQLTADIHQLSSMERQLSSWRGLYVRCPDPEPDELGAELGDKKSSSGYSTESASPPGSRNTSGDGTESHSADGCGVDYHGVGRYRANGQGTDGYGNTMNGRDGYTVNGHRADGHSVNGYRASGDAVNGYRASGDAVNGQLDIGDATDGFARGRYTVNSFKPSGDAVTGWGADRGLSRAGQGRGSERATGAIRRPVAMAAPQNGANGLVNGLSQSNSISNGVSNGLRNGLSNDDGEGAIDASTTSSGFAISAGPGPDLSLGERRSGSDLGSRELTGGGQWREVAGPGSPVRPRRAGLLQSSLAHSSEPRQLTPLVSRAPFCPPAASTPTLSPKLPRSPKTLRFAASHELIPPDSPSRRRVSAGAPPRPGILRSRASSAERREGLSRPAPPGWRAGSSSSSPSPGRGQRSADSPGRSGRSGGGQDAADSAERFSRVVSALSRLEAELSGAQRRPPAPRAACGTAQFVRHPPRRQLSFTALPPPPQHPRLLSGSATDSDDSDSDSDSDSRWLVDSGATAQPPAELPSEGDFVLSRGARLPPPYSSQPPRRRRSQLSWLLSCGSRRRPPSPPSAYLPPPPSEPPAPAAGAAYGCNLCKARFAEHFQLVSHVHERHVRVQMRPKYSCGLCPARFYASKFLARHCAYHHNSMGDARTPQCLKTDSAA